MVEIYLHNSKLMKKKLNKQHKLTLMRETLLLYEYRDLFIDMDVRNNRSKLAIANRHQER